MWGSTDDTALIARIRDGDRESFEILFDKYRKQVYSYITRMTGDRNAAEDLFQELFMKFISNIDKYNEQGKFAAWLFTSANHIAIDYLRKKGKNGVIASLDEAYFEGCPTLGERLASKEQGPEAVMLNAEQKTAIEKAFGKLSTEQRQIFFLREYSGLSFKEIAAMLNIPVGTALARMSRALAVLRGELKENGIKAA